jgi:hypothetical protein
MRRRGVEPPVAIAMRGRSASGRGLAIAAIGAAFGSGLASGSAVGADVAGLGAAFVTSRVPPTPRIETARADGGTRFALLTEVTCDPLPGPGKVQCVVRVRPVGGSLRWSDAIVVAAPSFAPPLRTRVAAGDAKRNDADGVEFSLALAATGDGVGELKVLARGAVCGDGGCRPVQAEGTARVAVGATTNGTTGNGTTAP